MKPVAFILFSLILLISVPDAGAQSGKGASEELIYHQIKTDSNGKIQPWFADDEGAAYDHVIHLIWDFWDTMRADLNGLPYYMNHQVWRNDFNDRRGIGGDQLAMALSSWNLYYAYSGNERVKENMKFLADYYLTHSLSPEDAVWPNLPYPYNTRVYSGQYDGDMILGKNYTQPDKAGSFGLELLKLYKMTERHPYTDISSESYLYAATEIANTLADHTIEGDENTSPLPFKVNAISGETGILPDVWGSGLGDPLSSYTTNWAPVMELFLQLIELDHGKVELYRKAFDKMLKWMKKYPLQNNRWGPFFEDIPGWSDTQINAVTFAQFMMNHNEYFPEWEKQVRNIFKWVYHELGNHEWYKYGVTVINEQTAYQTPGNSHSSRQASAELQLAALTGDTALIEQAILKLNWATYMVDEDGKNRYPQDENWLTDGYGDYVRHYLRSMAYYPELAPSGQNHLLSSTSIVQLAEYPPLINRFISKDVPPELVDQTVIHYRTFDKESVEMLKLDRKPSAVLVNKKEIPETSQYDEGWNWKPLSDGGIVTVKHTSGNQVIVLK